MARVSRITKSLGLVVFSLQVPNVVVGVQKLDHLDVVVSKKPLFILVHIRNPLDLQK